MQKTSSDEDQQTSSEKDTGRVGGKRPQSEWERDQGKGQGLRKTALEPSQSSHRLHAAASVKPSSTPRPGKLVGACCSWGRKYSRCCSTPQIPAPPPKHDDIACLAAFPDRWVLGSALCPFYVRIYTLRSFLRRTKAPTLLEGLKKPAPTVGPACTPSRHPWPE